MNDWQWHLDHGVWRVTSPQGVHYSIEMKGPSFIVRKGRRGAAGRYYPTLMPEYMGTYASLRIAIAVCRERDANAAGTVDRESETNLQLSHR